MRYRVSNPSASSEIEKQSCTKSLRDVVFHFCGLLEWIDEALVNGFSFFCGKQRLPPKVVQRRNVELLAVIALNLGIEEEPALAFEEIWNRVQRVCLKMIQTRSES